MDIEEVAHRTPEKIVKVFVDPLAGLSAAQGAELARGVGMPMDSQAQFIDVSQVVPVLYGYRCFAGRDQPPTATARA